jgi:8-oxo-dGTP pyrophosphatase MutT (NUDIX family)
MKPPGLREIERDIASALIFSSDGYLLMGRKEPGRGGVYPNAWHIPGGGVHEGESLEEAVIREVKEEVDLQIHPSQLRPVKAGYGEAIKALPSGEQVWCKMRFNRFEVRLDQPKAKLDPHPGDDLVELAWYAPDELAGVEQIPGGREFFIEQGYIKARV